MKTIVRFLGKRWAKLALVAWFAGMSLVAAGLLARHAVALPAPKTPERLGAELGAMRGATERGSWLAVHVLYSQCPCSQRIATHLVGVERPRDWKEIVVWVGDAPVAAGVDFEAKGFVVKHVSEEDLAKIGVESAPLLVALDPDDHVRYSGGYTTHKQGPDISDREILEAVRFRGGVAEPLPVFGCAVSERLKRALSVLPTS